VPVDLITDHTIVSEFPILQRSVHGKPLVYLDNAATTQKPRVVIDAIAEYYENSNANVHRGGHALGTEATDLFEAARQTVADFIGAPSASTIVFTSGATGSINLVAASWGRTNIHQGDVVALTTMEHHANIVPWYMLCEEVGATLEVVRVLDDGTLDMDHLRSVLASGPKLLAITHVSNTLGTVNPINEICAMARENGVITLVDGAQSVQHQPVDVVAMGCDLFVFSAHKLFGPTGIGVLYGRDEILAAMPPYQGGGSMISTVSFDHITYNDVPMRFEAGTPHIAGAVGMAAAIRWFSALDRDMLQQQDLEHTAQICAALSEVPGARIIGTAPERVGIVSFVVDGVHASDIGTLLDTMGVAIRIGHHCTQPLMQRFGVTSTARVSTSVYTTSHDIDVFTRSLHKALSMLR
jgi:cysteine desulfurase/selenocysteine lyase